MKKDKKVDFRTLEPNQNITKLYAVSYATLTYNHIQPKGDVEEFGYEMIELMRAIKPKFAVKEANKLLQSKRQEENK